MRRPKVATRSAGIFAVPLFVAGVIAGVVPAVSAAAAQTVPAGSAASFSVSGHLNGVAATSGSNAWAVGCTGCFTSSPKALIARWNGTGWKRVPSGAPAGSVLSGVAATSATNAWAVGSIEGKTSVKTLILRWTGTSWTKVPSPTPAGGQLSGVAATSSSNAWAVGFTGSGTSLKTLILRWNGKAWSQVSSPGAGGSLSGVTATSASNAWAVGCASCGTQNEKTLIVRWNGSSWKQVSSPAPVSTSALFSVAATSASNAWAVGCRTNCLTAGINQLLILRWNGTSWKQVPSPAHIDGELLGVTAVSASNAWAVGGHYTSSGSTIITKTLTLQWNGTAWKKVPSPSPGASAGLSGVAATSAGSAWAVGGYYTSLTSGSGKTLAEQWNGKTWK